MYQSSSESSIEHGNFPSVINLYAVGENSSAHQVQAQKTTKTSSASQTYAQTGRTPLDHRGDPFLALAASSSPSSYSRRQFNEDEASYASSPTYAESPTGGCGSSSGSQPAILPAMTSSAISRTSGPKAAPRDRTGSCGSPQSSDSESHSEGDRQQQQRQLSSSSSSTSSEELRPAAFKARIWSAASSGLRKKPPPPPPPPPPPQLQSNIPQRAGMNIVGSPSPSSNSAGSNPGCGTRHSLISQFSSATGRMETVLAETIVESIALQCAGGVADSGISNTSPETQSSTEFQHLILAKADASSSRTPTLMLGGKAPRQHCSQQHQLLSPRRHPQQVGRHGTPLVGILKPTGAANIDLQTGYMQEAFKASLANILSGIYCILLCCLGLLIPAKVVYSKQSAIEFSFEAFYIYLFVTAIGFMACVYALLLREGADTAAATSSRLDRRWTARRNPGVRLLRRSAAKGGLYLRLGAIVFGIASMIRDGIALAASLQHGSQLTNCSHPIVPIRGALSILFTFVQLNFLFFMNAKMCINKYQVVARFFLAHLVATNTCVWLRTVLLDSSLRTSAQSSLLDRNHSIATIDRHLSTETPPAYDRNSSCATDTDSFIRDMIWKSDPYLFPVTVQYCALSAAILCAVWQNVGQLWPPRRRQILGEDLEDDDDENVDDDDDEAVAAAASAASESAAMDSQQSPHRLLSTSPAATYRRQRRNTCDGSHRGLCLGLASLVCAAVALLTSAALWQQPRFHRAASLVSHCSELALLAASLAATLAAFPRLADLLYEASKQLDWPLDEALQLLGFGGGCLYWLAGLVPSGDAEPAPPPHRVLTCLAQPVQAAAQLALLCTARRRRCYKALHAREKPGRELVTYLLVANIALLGFATAEPSRGSLSVIERIGLPMHCLYRCHSVALLADLWKEIYKFKAS